MQVRLLLEPQVATLAARIATQADLDRIAALPRRRRRQRRLRGFEAWDARLHRAIAQAAHNGLLMNMFDVLNTARALPVWGTLKRRTCVPNGAPATTANTPPSSTPCATATRMAHAKPWPPTCRTSPTTCSAATERRPPG